MLRTTTIDAVTSIQEALTTLPSELEARSEFFVQWRTRTVETLETGFREDPGPARLFKDIEFSPRRLTKDEARDAQLKLDAYLAGCAAARTLLESLLWRLNTAGGKPAESQAVQVQAATPQLPAANSAPAPAPAVAVPVVVAAVPVAVAAVPVAVVPIPLQAAPVPVAVPAAPTLPSPPVEAVPPYVDSFVTGGSMEARDLCAPVRSSLSRVLGAWDRGDREMALVLSAQLLADLTVLARHDQFRSTFENVVSNAVDSGALPGGAEAFKSAAPLCVWSLVAAMNEVMRN